MKQMGSYIKDLIAEGEHQRLDFKFEISDSKKIARTLAAFANTNGGSWYRDYTKVKYDRSKWKFNNIFRLWILICKGKTR